MRLGQAPDLLVRRLTQPSLKHKSREEVCELGSHGLKGKLLQRALLRFGHDRGAGINVVQQLQRDGSDFVDRASFATGFWKRDSFNRAVSARANHPAKKHVTRDLSRHSATVEL